ncbi:extracellular tyrosine-protein kinase PKDCC isoform X1 [Salmo salar]|uniref:Extracellular tyrosine-protein kinase PKDCC isoform X1 n=1 Tax=Salmo salar TaxID=8030 RepID=A0A1S3SDT7_SALSA|nr:extracellular tyrosine-protein kinase PKDCC isoform X1 [Salmo salar]
MRSPLCAAALLYFLVFSLTFFMNSWHLRVHKVIFSNGTLQQDFVMERNALVHELKERRKEILPFLIYSGVERLLDESVHFAQHQSFESNTLDISLENESEVSIESIRTNKDHIGCEQLADMKAVDILGSGYTKIVLKVVLSEGHSVALKTVYDKGTDMGRCLADFKDPLGCHKLLSFKLKKEIVLLQRLQHPNIIKLIGHCEDSKGAGGITAILEQGIPLQMIQLLQSPWEERFRVCLGLVRLLHFLSHSPLGSVALLDFQPRQFVMVSGELKLTDLDDASVTEPTCQTDQDCVLQFPLRNFSQPCSAQGVCEGLNEMRNLYNAYRYFFTYLLPHQAPASLRHLVDHIMNSTGEMKGDVDDTLEAFEDVLHLYKSGIHLDNMPPSLIRDYAVMRGISTSGNMESRCWPSYNHQGCMLSVHSAKEAAFICNSHPQCTSFSLNNQRTWTGRLLASFRSGFSYLVPDVNSEVYLKKTKASPGTTV